MKNLSIVLIVFTLFACSNETQVEDIDQALKNFNKMSGQWKLQPKENSIEIWSVTETGLVGQGMTIGEANDTTTTEAYFVEKDGDRLRLQVQPINDGGMADPINFYLKESTPKRFVFDSPDHKMPKRLIFLIHKKEYSMMKEYEIGGTTQQLDLVYKKK